MRAEAKCGNEDLQNSNLRTVAGLLTLLLLLPLTGQAGGVVTQPTETALRTALAGGGLVTFACDGTIALAKTITNTVDAVLDATGHQITISGAGSNRVLCLATNVHLRIVNLTLARGLGRRGGGILNAGGQLQLEGVLLQDHTASYEAESQTTGAAAGGGLFNQGGTVAATNCTFAGNLARQQASSSTDPSRTRGGALANEGGTVSLHGCFFVGNSVTGAPGPFNIRGTAHEANGGAIANAGTLVAHHCDFIANSANGEVGGGIAGAGGAANGGALGNWGELKLNQCAFLSNSVTGGRGGDGASGMPYTPPGDGGSGGLGGSANGGALFNAGVAVVANCSFTGNRGHGGAGGPGGAGYPNMYPHGGPGGSGGPGGQGGPACGAICDLNALCLLTNCVVMYNASIGGEGGPGGPGGGGNPSGATGGGGAAGQTMGSLRSVGGILMATVLVANVPGGNASGTFTDGGGNSSSEGTCVFAGTTPGSADANTRPTCFLIHNFTGQEDRYVDAHPFSGMLASSSGIIYGVTSGDAWPGAGAVFRVHTNGAASNFAVIQAFGNDPTYGPAGAVAQAGDLLYGTTVLGGQSNRGTIYRVRTDGSNYEILHSFTGGSDGQRPDAGLTLAGNTLYGSTSFGGNSGYGTLYKIGTNGLGYSIVKHFAGGADGASPGTEMLLAGGVLYGTTSGGGGPGGSTVFKINPDGTGYTVLKYFDPALSQGRTTAGLAISASTLFGVTLASCYDGPNARSLIFKVNTDGSDFTTLYELPCDDAPARNAGLIFANGRLYGTTDGDGSATNRGSVFLLNTDGSGFTVLKRFCGTDGAEPDGQLLLMGNTLYGTTVNGGFYSMGVVFGLSLAAPQFVSLPPSQTAEVGDWVTFSASVAGFSPTACQWFWNDTNLITDATGPSLQLGPVHPSRSGAYTLVLSNALGVVTSAPVRLNVIAPVARQSMRGLKLSGAPGSTLNVEWSDAVDAAANWNPLTSVTLTNPTAFCFDLTPPQPEQRFYRAWQSGTPGTRPSVEIAAVPTLVLTGNPGSSLRMDWINRSGPVDGWSPLGSVTLTNTTQLFFDVSALGQPPRLYRLVPLP